MGNGFIENKQIFLAYTNDNDERREGFFILKDWGKTGVIVKTTHGNILFIPNNRIIKAKQEGEDEVSEAEYISGKK